MYNLDVFFINPRDLSIPIPYTKAANLAGVLLDKEVNCQIIDPLVSKYSINSIIESAKKLHPKLICVSVFPSTLPDAYQTIQKIKKNLPDIPVMVEGYMVNADPKCVKELDADFGLIGDGEASIFELFNLINQSETNKEQFESIAGIVINKDNYFFEGKPALVHDLNTLPMPAYHLLPIGEYYSASTNEVYMVTFTDRGCPYDCSFCASINQRNFRSLTTDNIIKQLKVLIHDLNVEFLEFMNLTFTINKRKTIELCEAIIDNNLKFNWACETRVDLVDDELLSYMKKAGCQKITFGVESGSEEIRNRTGKNISNDKFLQVFKLCKQHGIKTMANFIIGHPDETYKNVLETINFCIKLEPFNVLITKMTPLPDVDIYYNSVKENNIEKDIWYQYMKQEIPFPVIYPKKIGKFKMELLYRYAYIRFYLRPISFKKFLPMFSNIKFAFLSLKVFFRFVFGPTLYK